MTRLFGRYRVLIGRAGAQVQGARVHAKNGGTPSPSMVPGAKTRTVREEGGWKPFSVRGAEKTKRARCLGIFQFRRPW
jgi:hypothetical protein